MIALALLPLATLLSKWRYGGKIAIGISGLLALFGGGWLLDRAFNLEIMPF